MKTKYLIITLVICCFSCSKEPSSNLIQESSEHSSVQKSNFDFDIFGVSHNRAMDYVGYAPRFKDMSKYERYIYIHGYSDDDFSYSISDTNWVDFQEKLDVGIELANNPKSAASILLNEGIITSLEYNLIDSLFMIFEEAADFDNETYLSIEEFNEKVSILENHIYKNYKIEYDDFTKKGNFAAGMLGACSIMRHSFAYWREAVNDPNHPWHEMRTIYTSMDEHGNLNRGLFGKIWHGIKVGGVDTGVFLYSIFTKPCDRPKEDPGVGPSGSLSCAWNQAGAASSNV